ncbi:MAG: methyl viologen-reducing hydrogenase [Desulfobacterales bacterium]|nr:methyl viologen-reducing hydrogenase [Desulfobacterales bacterium]
MADIVHIPALVDSKYFGPAGRPEAPLPAGGRRRPHQRRHPQRGAPGGGATRCARSARSSSRSGPARPTAGSRRWPTPGPQARSWSGPSPPKPRTRPDAYPSDGVPALLESLLCRGREDQGGHLPARLPAAPRPGLQRPGRPGAGQAARACPTQSVCDTCPTVRKGKGELKQVRRFLQAPHYQAPDEPLDQMRCLLEQGLLCMGPVTRAGCGGDAVTPRCISARVPCRGCSGPVRHEGNQLLDMLNALASNGIDIKSIPNRALLLRFSGAHSSAQTDHPRKEIELI